MTSFIIISLCCAAVSFTITTTSIFRPLRDWVSKFHHKLEELIHCPWCLNHYVVVFVLIFGNPISFYDNFADFIVGWFSVVGAGGLIHYVLLRAYEPVAKATAIRNLEKVKRNAKTDIQSIH